MSIYSTVTISRNEAIQRLTSVMRWPSQMTNEELEEEMFNKFGREGLENSRLENYTVKD